MLPNTGPFRLRPGTLAVKRPQVLTAVGPWKLMQWKMTNRGTGLRLRCEHGRRDESMATVTSVLQSLVFACTASATYPDFVSILFGACQREDAGNGQDAGYKDVKREPSPSPERRLCKRRPQNPGVFDLDLERMSSQPARPPSSPSWTVLLIAMEVPVDLASESPSRCGRSARSTCPGI